MSLYAFLNKPWEEIPKLLRVKRFRKHRRDLDAADHIRWSKAVFHYDGDMTYTQERI
jgi:hypothetical protein